VDDPPVASGFPVEGLRISECEQRGQALSHLAVLHEDILTTERMLYANLMVSQPAERVVSIVSHQACSFSVRKLTLKADST
jgi:hypothetical protein